MKKYIILLMFLAGCSNTPASKEHEASTLPDKFKVGECFRGRFIDVINNIDAILDVKVIKLYRYGMAVSELKHGRSMYLFTNTKDSLSFIIEDCP